MARDIAATIRPQSGRMICPHCGDVALGRVSVLSAVSEHDLIEIAAGVKLALVRSVADWDAWLLCPRCRHWWRTSAEAIAAAS